MARLCSFNSLANDAGAPEKAGALRVLHVTPSFYPATGLGGPIFSTKALCDGLAARPDIVLRVLTTDAAAIRPPDRIDVEQNPLLFPAGYEVLYCRRIALASVAPTLLARLAGAIRWADVVHVTASYSFPTIPALTLCRLMGRPVVWSPRGGLQATAQWSDAPNRRLKHALEHVCQAVRPRRTVLHVTAAMEAETSRERLASIETAIIPNSIVVPDTLPPRQHRANGRLRLMFISRLHEKKGIEVLIDALAQLPDHVKLDIYGDGEANYVAALHARVAGHGLAHRVSFHGHVEGDAKTRAFTQADIFCLPTWSENFGIVVGEALAHGLPAITTTAAPWGGLEQERCGLWTETGVAPLVEAIRSLEDADLAAMGARGREWMIRDFSPDAVSRDMAELYQRLAAGSHPAQDKTIWKLSDQC